MGKKEFLSTSCKVQKYFGNSIGNIAAVWGVSGACLFLAIAVWRMFGRVIEGFEEPLGPVHYAVLVPWVLFMAYSEGYKGFQKSFSPRVASRAVYLRKHSTPLRAILAPVFCMGFFDSTRKRKIVIWVLLIGVTLLVILFNFIPQPWRGVLDFGVVVGLSWGVMATLICFFKYWFNEESKVDPEIPNV